MQAKIKLALFTAALLMPAVPAASTALGATTGQAPTEKPGGDSASTNASPTVTGTTDPAAEGNNGKRTGETPGSGGLSKGTAAPRPK